MAKGFSKAIIMGNLTRDPELRTTASGTTVCSLGVAVNRTYRDASGNNVESVSYINCTAWGRAAETMNQYLKKGDGVLISGRLDQRSWEDKATGQKRSTVEIVVEEFNFLPRGNGANGNGGGSWGSANAASAEPPKGGAPDVLPDDIPDGAVNLDDMPF